MISLRRTPNKRYAFCQRGCPSPSIFKQKIFGGTTVKAYIRGLYASQMAFVAATLGMLVCAVLLTLSVPCASYAQDTGYISGTVIDKSGAAVVGAEVVLTNTAGSITRTTLTNNDGAY